MKDPHPRPQRSVKASGSEAERALELAKSRARAIAKLRSHVHGHADEDYDEARLSRSVFRARTPEIRIKPATDGPQYKPTHIQVGPTADRHLQDLAMEKMSRRKVVIASDDSSDSRPEREPVRSVRVRPQDEYEVFEASDSEIQECVEEFADIMYDYMMLIINPDFPPSIKVETSQRGYRVTYAICESEYGKVKGRHGAIITSIQSLARALGGKLRQEIEVILLPERALVEPELVYTKGPLFKG